MPVQEKTLEGNAESRSNPDIERLYRKWDAALSKNDVPGILALYGENAELQSPLVPHLMNWGWFGFNVLKKDQYRR